MMTLFGKYLQLFMNSEFEKHNMENKIYQNPIKFFHVYIFSKSQMDKA